ncbi:MAG: methyltransferase domain-containing protein [Thermodesulfobacteriota bacterium]|nr:methyltransferase domain-containing protein [Thermodesulfobacteriota bacterium]
MRNISGHYLGERGKDYVSSHGFQAHGPGRAWQCGRYFAPHVRPEDVVLDLGANDGFMLSLLDCAKRIGIEVNPHSRALAPAGVEMHEDFSAIPDSSIDVVISNHCLEHIPMPLQALGEISRVLKQGGKLVLVTPVDDMHKPWAPGDPDNHLHTWTPLNIGNLLTEAGFTVQSVQLCRTAWSPKLFPLLRFEAAFRMAAAILSRIKRRQEVCAVAIAK